MYCVGILNSPVLIIISRKIKVNKTIFSPETFLEYSINMKNTNIKNATKSPKPPKA